MKVTLRSRYSDRSTFVHARKYVTSQGDTYLYISKRQLDHAAKRCCLSGDDFPRADTVPGFGEWEPTRDGGMDAWRLA